MPDGWNDTVAAFAKSDRSSYKQLQNRPERAKALGLMHQFIENCKFRNCAPDAAYLNATVGRSVPTAPQQRDQSNTKGTNP